MKYLIATVLLIIMSHKSFAQNLVPNPSFEEYTACPAFYGDIEKATNWFSFRESPDYFNSCANAGVSVPVNSFGHQSPIEGQAYAGLVTYSTGNPQGREYLGTQLTQPLVIGVKYYFSIFVSRADTPTLNGASNNFGFKFSTVPYTQSNPSPIDNSSHYHSTLIITDQDNWVKISGSFTADSTYTYLMIGNFYNDAQTDIVDCVELAYYFVDGICTTQDSLYNEHWTSFNLLEKDNIFTFPNPATDNLLIQAQEPPQYIEINDAIGRRIYYNNDRHLKTVVNVTDFSPGIYYVIVTSLQKRITKAISIVH